ncbi:nucleotidyl transferase [Melioribacter roseus P3M-2]|uniref:Nucleotidyl transferase n=1 Tax=Melioribacter roseus (strain DSM 23840 / JCM 17771 / VKM B-2668 / P3M-2) TaxID=1191523 RepID=I7A146_MELRP|nr:nucleotidyltransferase family protein [Melioribacter roseus]AFN74913.1 nucleotidyl transferase [Melioribacter roseus P3M-2]
MEAFILAAGLGTRLRPLTDTKPKALVEIKGVPLLDIVIRKLINAGFTRIVINVHHFAGQIISFLNSRKNYGVDIIISDESDKLLDTGGGLKKAAIYFTGKNPVLVHNVDILSGVDLKEFYRLHIEENNLITLAVQKRKSSRYFLFDEEKNLYGWMNEKTGEKKIVREPEGKTERLAFNGIHVVHPEVFNYFPEREIFSLVEFYLELASQKNLPERNKISYIEHTDSLFMDLGRIENLKKAERYL